MRNGEAIALREVPVWGWQRFEQALLQRVAEGARVSALFAMRAASGGATELVAVLAADGEGVLRLLRTALTALEFPSLTDACPQVHLFEREIAEQYGLVPQGHPWLKPVRFPPPVSVAARAGAETAPGNGPRIGQVDFYRVQGEEVHEVGVGPVHAGIIEPGHFRFQCMGEQVFHLEISLGYQHRGVERALEHGAAKRALHYAETLAGDSSVAHATAHARALEALGGCRTPPRAEALRAVALELERLANHVGDLGALALDVGFLPSAAYCGRIRGDFLNMTAALCGNRFGRGLVRPGGVGFDPAPEEVQGLLEQLDAAMADATGAIQLLWNAPSAMARFDHVGALPQEVAAALGAVGPVARSCGLARDVRKDHPVGAYQRLPVPVAVWESGDVFARAYLRWLEIQHAAGFVREQLRALPGGEIRMPVPSAAPDALAVSLVEGWRGEACHVVVTDSRGGVARYKVVDPSFHNWSGLAYAMRGQQISDFPVCNKSFNLSYCGHDL